MFFFTKVPHNTCNLTQGVIRVTLRMWSGAKSCAYRSATRACASVRTEATHNRQRLAKINRQMACIVAGHSRENAALESPRSTIDSQREKTRFASLRNQLRKVLESVAATRQQIETIRQREGFLAIQSTRVIREAIAPSIGHSEHEDMPFTEVQIRWEKLVLYTMHGHNLGSSIHKPTHINLCFPYVFPSLCLPMIFIVFKGTRRQNTDISPAWWVSTRKFPPSTPSLHRWWGAQNMILYKYDANRYTTPIHMTIVTAAWGRASLHFLILSRHSMSSSLASITPSFLMPIFSRLNYRASPPYVSTR